MSTFPYPPLDIAQNSIRLLRVQKGAWPGDVYCSLIEATTAPNEAVPYKALSYTWGAVEGEYSTQLPLPRIFVNNQVFPATDNLRMALGRIQDPNHDIMLWVDAICINQLDNCEKGRQVKQMAHIYKNAEEVLIWLGASSEEIEDLFELVATVDRQAISTLNPRKSEQWANHCHDLLERQYKSAKTPQNINVLRQLLSRRWFTRIWVLQEVAMARSARIICGSSSCQARTFCAMPSFFKIPTTIHSQAVLDLVPRRRCNTWWASDRTLHNLLVKFRQSQATDEKDMIYALLSMSQDASDPTQFYPSYEVADSQALKNTASFVIFGRMHSLRAGFPEVSITELRLSLENLIILLLKRVISRCNTHNKYNSRVPILIQQIGFMELSTAERMHCLSTFLNIALIKPHLLTTWFDARNPTLLQVCDKRECRELQDRTRDKPRRIMTLIFEQMNVQEEYQKIEFPIFNRLDNIENLSLPEDLDRWDRPNGYDSFERFAKSAGFYEYDHVRAR
ncbi:hypothetical protein ACHAQK_001672 [Fusarium lateritium]